MVKSPLIVKPLILRMSPPVLASLIVKALLADTLVLPKDVPKPEGGVAKIATVSVAPKVATAPSPEPLRLTVCGLPGALLAMVNVPARTPVAVGLKITFNVQKPDTPKPLPQLLVTEKSPVVVMLLIPSAAVPALVNVMLWAALVLPLFCNAKELFFGRPVTSGVSLKLAVTDLAASMVTVQVAELPALAQAPPQLMKLSKGAAVRSKDRPGWYDLLH